MKTAGVIFMSESSGSMCHSGSAFRRDGATLAPMRERGKEVQRDERRKRQKALSYGLARRELVRQVPTQNQLFADSIFRGLPLKPPKERKDPLNRNEKEKTARIEIRVRPKNKNRIEKLAERCGLSVSEYMVKRALGYEPRAVQPDAFFAFYQELCKLSDREMSQETERRLLDIIERIQLELLLPGKEAVPWQPPGSGLSKAD